MTVSIIIAIKTWQKNLEECVGKCQELDFPDFEILILPDEKIGDSPLSGTVPSNVKIIPTGPVSPGKKRDIAAGFAKGEILAFIDDDAWPRADWLKNAIENFKEAQVAAVGGPAITPPNDNLRQRASGAIYSSFLVGGKYSYRYIPKPKKEVDDYPSCNFLVRKAIMQELGGFNTLFWPGEDTKLCLDITKGLGKKIIYDPAVLVYHHRRPLYKAHLRQIANYALHRGYFVKRYPETSLRLAYFIPSVFLLTIIFGLVLSILLPLFSIIYALGLFFYLFSAFVAGISRDWRLTFLVFSGIILTHFTYGFYFLKGLLSKKLAEEK